MSATPDSTLANPEQLIADLERRLAEREAERDEYKAERDEYKAERDRALQRETATAEVLQIINSSPGDLAPVFDAMLERAMRLCDGCTGNLWTFDNGRARLAASRGLSAEIAALLRTRGEAGTHPLLLRIMQGEHLIQIPDFAEHELYRSEDTLGKAVQASVESGIRSLIWVALVKDGAALGAFVIGRTGAKPFSDQQIALLENFAAQAVIAIENARLLTETREALEQQTATAEVLQVINSSPGDLAPVFDAILEKATQLCEAPFGVLRTWDGERFHVVAAQGDPEFTEWVRGYGPFAPADPSSPAGRIVSGEEVVRFADAPEEEALSISPGFRALVESSGMRSNVIVALRKDGTLRGNITVFRREVRPFTDQQIALLENFAAQAVIAMENARLLTETREALEQQTATAEVLQVINSSPGDLKPVFDAMLEKALRLCKAAFGMLWVNDGDCFRTLAHIGLPAELATFMQRPLRGSPPQGSALRQLIDGDDLVHVADITALPPLENPPEVGSAPPWLGTRAALVELGGARTQLVVALRKDESLVGFFHVYRREVQPFSDKEIALLQNFAAQAVIAMENARLITETREALEQQTATAEVLGVINSSPGDLAPVFDAMLEKTLRLCEAAHGNFLTYDGEVFHRAAFRGEPQFAEYRRPQGPQRPAEHGQLARMVQGGGTLHRIDAREGEAYRDDPGFRRIVDGLGIRTSLTVPLRKGDALLGAVRAYRLEVRPFTDKQIALVENFAAQAVIAMENARLINETREALEQQTATAEVLQVINSSPGDLTPVFEAILEKAHTLCGATYGGLVIRDRDGFHNVAARGDPQFVERWRQLRPLHPPQGSPLSRLMAGEKFIHLADAPADDNYRNTTPPEILQLSEFGGLRTLLMVPLRTDNAFLGFISAFRLEVQPFTDKQIALLENFAAQAVIAMENARLLGELHQRTDEVAELNRGLEARVAEQVDELGRVGRLKRFLAPQLAELIVSQGDEKILESHRRDIVVVFCDLRGYTAFTETAEPEEVLDFLREYHGALGPLVSQFEGTLDQFSGDGIMVFFNDPVPCPDPAERAVKMAMAMREEAGKLIAAWRRDGCELGFGAGIAQGYATLGQIGFSDRSGYTAIGTVCNLAARLCAEAKDGQILISSRVARAVEAVARLEDLGNLELKGLRRPVAAFNVMQSTNATEARPNLTVVARGPEV